MYLIDTDIMIYSLKGVDEVVERFRSTATQPKAISVITYGELLFGAKKSQQQRDNLARIHRVAEIFPVIDVTRSVMETFSSIKVDLESKGQPLDDFDLLIAATALVTGYCLVTNNERHFRRIPDLTIENWSL
jgi:tRNA(fMet)-specific endonuclease VapC